MTLFNVLVKWLAISALVLSVLFIVLLLLGYLLSDNEKNTRAYLSQQAAQEQANFQKAANNHGHDIVATKADVALKIQAQQAKIEAIIVNNLICTDVSQCRLVETNNATLGCVVAINIIGKNLLAKEQLLVSDKVCLESMNNHSLACELNICTIK